MSILAELKNIEEEIEKENDAADPIYFCFCCDQVKMDLSDINPLKDILVKNKVVASDDIVTLSKLDEPVSDMKNICEEWHFKDEITSSLINIVENSDGYYRMWADGTYT